MILWFSSVPSLSRNSLRPHGLQYTRPPCPSPAPRVYSNSCLLSQWSHPTISFSAASFSFCLQSFPASGLFQWASSSHQVAKVLELQLQLSPSNEYLRLVSFRIGWFDLLAVQGTPKSLLEHCNSKASMFWCSAFFIVQLSHLYLTTGKSIALTIWTFLCKVISLLFNMLSRIP